MAQTRNGLFDSRLWLVAVVLILFHKPASAGAVSAMTADALMEKCHYADADLKKLDTAELSNLSVCMGYISGVVDGYAVGVTTSSTKPTMLCSLPEEVTLKQMTLIVVHYGKENPSELYLPASIVVMKALNKSFPCQQ